MVQVAAAARARSSASRSSRRAQQRARAPGRRAARPPRAASAQGLGLARGRGQPRQVDHGQRTGRGRVDDLDGLAVLAGGRWCAATRGGARARRGRAASAATSSAPVSAQRARACCRAALPGSSWSRNHRRCWAKDSGSAALARHRRERRRAAAPRRSGAPPRCRAARAASGGRLEEGAQRQLDAEGGADARDDLGGQQRVAAQLEEVVVDADALARRSSSRPDAGEQLLGRRARRDVARAPSRARAPARAGPCGPPCRWASAAARPARTKAAGTMYSGSVLAQVRAQRRGVQRSAVAGTT